MEVGAEVKEFKVGDKIVSTLTHVVSNTAV